MNVKIPELLAPAGSPEGVRAAVQSGAGAVYMGFGTLMRAATRRAFRTRKWRTPSPTAAHET